MITTNERQENLIDEYGALINPSKARIMRDAGLGIIEERKEGAYVWDQDGTRYVDCRDDTCVYNVGRKNPELVAVLQSALLEYDLGNNLFFSEPRVQLAKKLAELSPNGELTAVAYGASGGEIVDFTIKLARAITGRTKVISMKDATHGSTGFAMSASATPEEKETFGPLVPGFKQVPYSDIKALEREIDATTACVILEAVQGVAGVRVPNRGYLQAVRNLCTNSGALLIVDEIETGFGRTGTMFAIEQSGVIPDIMVVGNSLSGGLYPLTAALFRTEYLKFWEDHPFLHHSTFGGSDLGCVMGLATIDYIERNHLPDRARKLGEKFAEGFEKLLLKYPAIITDFRSTGLLMAVDFANDEIGPQMSRDLSQFGVLASYSMEHPTTMRITPSLTLTDKDVSRVLEAFDNALAGCNSIFVPMSPDVLEELIRSMRR